MKRILIATILLATAFFMNQPLFAQNDEQVYEDETIIDDGRGWSFGLNVGVYYVSKYTANYYNGSDANENNVKYVLATDYWYRQIFDMLDANDSISVTLPTDMRYKMALRPGLYGQYNFNQTFALVIEFNFMRLKAEDAIVFEVDPKPYATEPDNRIFGIRGIEERVYADIGLKRTFPKEENLSYFVTGGLNVNSTKVQKSSFFVEDKEGLVTEEFSMINVHGNDSYVPNSNMQTFNVYQGGIGVGMYAGGGATFRFANSIFVEPGITAHWLMVKLKGYNNMRPGVGAYVRFLF